MSVPLAGVGCDGVSGDLAQAEGDAGAGEKVGEGVIGGAARLLVAEGEQSLQVAAVGSVGGRLRRLGTSLAVRGLGEKKKR